MPVLNASAEPAKSALARLRVATETGMHTVVLFTTDILKIFQINLATIVDASQLEDEIVEKIPTIALKGIIHEEKLLYLVTLLNVTLFPKYSKL